ncbi:MAG: 2Fe-2S iron-sulfur cluster binding domain-containing protein [Polyangiaceae bacterium]|nr:2Fe-2S iron-sulfur cluster binding domain-containing protein [Myxococcales bacterium]MCB9585059.1 2Fe-2S iron-sulfur cluster binding domain-containing protein [Polyangiaceae bacterium]MCB9610052.1 2Fe-2S iron-sulfur cluster binding domain-containing protein [Polyangiaceae bacterium]
MAKVRFIDQDLEVEVPVGTSILQASKQIHAPEGDACGGVCACSTCHVYVEEGANLLSEAEEDEEDILDKAFDVRMTSRLGCQAKIERDGLIAVRISQESLEAFYNEHPNEPRPADLALRGAPPQK